ncbi:signal peptidase I [Massilia sp. CF038]|uniref:signal peptidase I n=1 Tax=Massilia sp. CF038 TaxID=1881045 RepID=UPI000920D374|nr:signal peptidase I [Massilia sp. CF038]SHG70415.1 signal peptidase I Serine peptidase. MEROPS family S26A [Massilia sp. CF038]
MKNWVRSNKGFVLFLLLFGFFRTAIADWNPIPSGSMRPGLLEGDVVFVNRLAFNVKVPLTNMVLAHTGEPQRGDVVTFSSPANGTRLIKRIMAVPGDRVEMRGEQIIINGQAASYTQIESVLEPHQGGLTPALRFDEVLGKQVQRIQVLPAVSARRSFGPITVPPEQYLMLGDNRDNSEDSRFIGLVPRKLLVGRAVRVLVSADIEGNWMPRFERFGKPLHVDPE